MKLSKLYEQILTEDVAGKHLVVVDVQPEYQDGFDMWLYDFVNFLNENDSKVARLTFLYNGESLGMIELNEYQHWWYENELEEDIAFNSHYYDKGYAFFRYCMDEAGEEGTTNLVRYMMQQGVHDSRELDKEFWDGFVEEYGDEDVRELMEFSDDALHIPDLIDELKGYNNIVLCGGGINECLKEVEIALDAMGKPYQTLNQFTY